MMGPSDVVYVEKRRGPRTGENWLPIVLVLSEKSGKVVSCYRSGGRWWRGQRRELNVLKRLRMSGALLILLWKCEDLAVWTSVEKGESKD